MGVLEGNLKFTGAHQIVILGMSGDPCDGLPQQMNLGGVGDPRRLRDDDLLTQALEGGEDQGFAPWSGDDLVRRYVQIEDPTVKFGDGLPQFGNPRCRQVAALLHIPA